MAGVSDSENKHEIRKWLIDNRSEFNKVLDIGPGVGTYSIMGRFPEQHWDAVEVFEPYVEMFNLKNKYTNVFVDDIREANLVDNYNLIIAADMLEHMKKNEAKDVIKNLLDHCEQLFIGFPVVHHDQEAGVEGNEYETHVDHWDAEEMRLYLKGKIISEIVGDIEAYFLIQGNI